MAYFIIEIQLLKFKNLRLDISCGLWLVGAMPIFAMSCFLVYSIVRNNTIECLLCAYNYNYIEFEQSMDRMHGPQFEEVAEERSFTLGWNQVNLSEQSTRQLLHMG